MPISDTPFNQRSLIHREACFSGGPRIPKNPIFLKMEKIIQNAKTQKMSRNMPISATPFNHRSLIHREACFSGGPRIPKNPIFLKSGKHHPKRKNSRDIQKLEIYPLTRGLY